MSKQICDFCSNAKVVWRYPARTFVAYIVENVAGESVGDWAACEECHRLIEAGDGAGLAERSLEALIQKQPEIAAVRGALAEQMAALHVMFFENRTGEALPVL